MVDPKEFYNYLIQRKIDFFLGVPDPFFKNFHACIKDHVKKEKHIILENGADAVALASGYHIATGRYGAIYLKNTEIGTCLESLLCFADEEVCSIPMLLLIGWHGQFNNEVQFRKIGKLTLSLLDTMQIKYQILDDTYKRQISDSYRYMKEAQKPVALIIQNGLFSEYKKEQSKDSVRLTKEDALEILFHQLKENDFTISVRKEITQKICDLRKNKFGHDFFLPLKEVFSFSLGLSLGTKDNIYCIDDEFPNIYDLSVLLQQAKKNLKYIFIQNDYCETFEERSHFEINMEKIFKTIGFKNVYQATTKEEMKEKLEKIGHNKMSVLILYVTSSTKEKLEKIPFTPFENKEIITKMLRNK